MKIIRIFAVLALIAAAAVFAGCENPIMIRYLDRLERDLERRRNPPCSECDWGDWVITRQPTQTEEGEKTRTCRTNPSHTETRTIPVLPLYFVSIDEIVDFLNGHGGGNNADNPVPLPVNLQLTQENWLAILVAIQNAGRYVTLDLTASTHSGSNTGGGLRITGEFDPLADTPFGKNRIVSITLPNLAASVLRWQNARNITLRSLAGAWLTRIDDRAFMDCTNLVSIVTAELEHIGDFAFANTNLASINLPAFATLGANPFKGCSSLNSFVVSGTGALSAIEGGRALVRNGTELVSYPTAAGNITLPQSITRIGVYAFAYNTNLAQITLPAGLAQIDNRAFSGCTNLALVTVHAPTPPLMGAGVFAGTHEDLVIRVPAINLAAYRAAWGSLLPPPGADRIVAMLTAIDEIAPYLFAHSGGATAADPVPLPTLNLQLTEANWMDILTAIQNAGKYVTLDLTASTRSNVDVGGGLRYDGTFDPLTNVADGKNRIVSIVMPDAAASIVYGTFVNPTFRHFSNLKEIEGRNVVTIGDFAFADNTSLTSISFPAATSIGINAFANTSLTNISFPAVTTIGSGTFLNNTNLTNVSFPVATTIGSSAFQGNTSLVSVSFPAVTTINHQAFMGNSSLTKIELSAGLTDIGDFAFVDCQNLELVTIHAEMPPGLGANVFSNTHQDLVIRVPAGSVAAYKSAWGASLPPPGASRIVAIQ